MLFLIYCVLCLVFGLPWYAYVIGLVVWIYGTDWENA